MRAIIYVRDKDDISIYEQFNQCASHANRYGYSIVGKVLDFDGKQFHEAVNKIIPFTVPAALIIYSKEAAFDNNDDYLFYRIYLEKLGKKLITIT